MSTDLLFQTSPFEISGIGTYNTGMTRDTVASVQFSTGGSSPICCGIERRRADTNVRPTFTTLFPPGVPRESAGGGGGWLHDCEAPFPGDRRVRPSGIPGEAAEIGRTFLKEGVTSLLSFLAHVEEAGGVARQFHQPRLAVFVSIHGGLDEADRCGEFARISRHQVTVSSSRRSRGTTVLTMPMSRACCALYWRQRNQILAGLLLADHPGEVGGAVAGVEGTHFGPGLAENGIIGGNGQVADHGQDVAAADGIAGDHGDHGLRAGAYLAVQVQHVQPVLPSADLRSRTPRTF